MFIVLKVCFLCIANYLVLSLFRAALLFVFGLVFEEERDRCYLSEVKPPSREEEDKLLS
jgi:hypothetical protein